MAPEKHHKWGAFTMEEKKIFTGTFETTNSISIICLVIGVVSMIIGIMVAGDIGAFFELCFSGYAEIIFLIVAVMFWAAAFVIYMMMKNCQLLITDKRIYGRAAFGKAVSLPLDMISAVSLNEFKCLSVSTASGRISFWMITNGYEAWQIINNLIVERQKR